jgi:hypothetical protein
MDLGAVAAGMDARTERLRPGWSAAVADRLYLEGKDWLAVQDGEVALRPNPHISGGLNEDRPSVLAQIEAQAEEEALCHNL